MARVRPTKVKGQGQVQVRAFRRGSCCRKCKVLNVPTATGQHCPEGWTIYHKPGTAFQGIAVNSDLNYLIFVDRNGVLGLGKDIPMLYAVTGELTTRRLGGKAAASGQATIRILLGAWRVERELRTKL